MNTWFTSDVHFGHRNILKYCPNRPFASVEEMDDAIKAEWIEKVAPDDRIYFLGDFTFDPDPDRVADMLAELTGEIHIVIGNHDTALKRLLAEPWVRPGLEHVHFMERSARVENYFRVKLDGKSCVLNHYPLEEWPGMAYHGMGKETRPALGGRWHLHGHSHDNLRRIPARLDVGWDTENSILHWDDVVRIMHER